MLAPLGVAPAFFLAARDMSWGQTPVSVRGMSGVRPRCPRGTGFLERVRFEGRGGEAQERCNDLGVELGPRAILELLASILEAHGAAVRAVGGHRMEGVADEDHAGLDRNVALADRIGIALAVPALVAVAHDRAH